MPTSVSKTQLLSRSLRFVAVCMAGFLLTMAAVEFNFLFLFGESPDPDDVDNPELNLASEVWSADSVLIGKYFIENRSPVSYNEIAPEMIQALIATEDIRFYNHFGIDPKSAAAVVYYAAKGNRRGGSTITQQLAKNLFNTRDIRKLGLLSSIPGSRTVVYKLKEWITALRLEARYSKDEILVLYLNTVDFGNQAYGVKVAARTYFNTSPDSLKLEEAAMLVGLLKAPSFYNPLRNPERAQLRRNTVLSQMEKYDMLDPVIADSVQQLPVDLRVHNQAHDSGIATYARAYILTELREWARENGHNLFTDGLKIRTTLNARMQTHAERAVRERMRELQRTFDQQWSGRNPWTNENGREITDYPDQAIRRLDVYQSALRRYDGDNDSAMHWLATPRNMRIYTATGLRDTLMSSIDSLRHHRKFMHAGLVSLDPANGAVQAWVGGIDYRHFKFDHVVRSRRQPGSTFKPILFAAAFEAGLGPCDIRIDEETIIETAQGPWIPRNANGVYSNEPLTLRGAMARSVNTIAVQLTNEIGAHEVAGMARLLGVHSEVAEVPSIGLGTSDITLLEMAVAYAPFINGGKRVTPHLIHRVEDRNGTVLFEFTPDTSQVLSPETAFLMTHMLKGGLEEPGGTSRGLYAYDIFRGNEVGGKTGTTSNYSDGWYVGVTPQLVTAAWVGGEDRTIRFRGNQGEGGKTALPIVGQFLHNSYLDRNTGLQRMRFAGPSTPISKDWMCPVQPEIHPDEKSEDLRRIERTVRSILEGLKERLLRPRRQ